MRKFSWDETVVFMLAMTMTLFLAVTLYLDGLRASRAEQKKLDETYYAEHPVVKEGPAKLTIINVIRMTDDVCEAIGDGLQEAEGPAIVHIPSGDFVCHQPIVFHENQQVDFAPTAKKAGK